MASPLDVGTVTEALKEHYKPLRVQNMVYKDNPLLAMMPKYTKFGGENMPIPLIYSNPQRRSATFANGSGKHSTSALKQFVLTRVKDYSFASITGESIKATERDSDAFLRYATMEIDGALNSLTRSLAVAMYRDGVGTRGVISAEPSEESNMKFTLSNGEDVTNFEVGMIVQVWAPTGDTQRKRVNTEKEFTIDAVDRDAGTLTFTGEAYDSNGDIAANDLIIAQGDRNLVVSGLEAWVPTAATVTAGIPISSAWSEAQT
jgi:hypothetical protein